MTDWSKVKVVDLKAELKKRGLPQTGLKPALVARLASADNGEGSESETTVQDDAPKPPSSTTSPETISPTQPPSEPSAGLAAQEASAPEPDSTDPTAPSELTPTEPLAVESNSQALPTQSSDTIEASQPPSKGDAHHSKLPSVEPQELLEDRQKRKRRSQSPAISAFDASRKRLRPDEEVKEGEGTLVTSKDDAAWVVKHNGVDEADINAAAREVAQDGEGVEPGPTIIDVTKDEVKVEDVAMTEEEAGDSKKISTDDAVSESHEDSPSRVRDSRFKGLFSAPTASAIEPSKSRDLYEAAELETERNISPAIHPATSAIYIRDFMRPLNPSQLRSHLANLATPPGQDVDQNIVVDFYLDPIRTHAFISFINISAASRVRSALHGCIWPEERARKPLWADFIPLEKVEEWTEKEESTKAGGRAGAKKWEVIYDTDEDRHVTAYLQEAGKQSIRQQPPQQNNTPLPTSAPAAPFNAPSGPRTVQISDPKPVTSMKALDELFNSTETKPRLYWLPVDKSLANKRLDTIDDSTSKRYTPGIAGDINRYTFEDGDGLVDRGPEIFPGIRPPGGHRGGPRGGYRGVSNRGSYHSRGGYVGGDSYRGNRRGDSNRRGSWDDRRY
jgi:hypothetical protein